MGLVPFTDNELPTDVGRPGDLQVTVNPDAPIQGSRPNVWQIISSAFQQENSIVSALSSQAFWVDELVKDPTLNVWDQVKGTKYEDYFDRFANATTMVGVRAIQNDIDREEENRRILSMGGGTAFFSNILASILDWSTFLPLAQGSKTLKAGKAFKDSFIPIGVSAAAGTAIQEYTLHASQQTRTANETIMGVGGSFLLGGLLGAGISASMARSEFNKLANQMAREVNDVLSAERSAIKPIVKDAAGEVAQDLANVPAPGLVSIERAIAAGPEASDIFGLGKYLAAPVKWLNPILRGNTSPSMAVRDVVNNLVENSVYINKNFDGVSSPQAVETLMKEFTRGAMADAIASQREIFRAAKQAGENLAYHEFSERVGRAMRNGDFDEQGSKFVNQAAQAWRDKVFEPLKQKAIQAGLLPKDVSTETAVSYFSRVYNTRKIVGQEQNFKKVVRKWAEETITKEEARLQGQHNRALRNLQSAIDELEMTKLRRETEVKERRQAWGKDTVVDDDTIKTAVRLVQEGKRPPQPQTLTQFLHKMGGLVEENDVLKQLGITNKERPGFVRNHLGQNKTKGGISIDDAINAAMDAGFFETKPSRLEFLQTLSEDFFRNRRVVSKTDRPAAERANLYDQVVATIAKLGLDAKSPDFKLQPNLVKLLENVVSELNKRADVELANLRLKMAKVTDDFNELKANKFDMGAGRQKYLDDIVDTVFNKITGREIKELPDNLSVATRGPLKERTFDIQDKLIQDFLIDDVEHVAHRYARVMSADIELTNKYGSADLKYAIQAIRDEYENLRELLRNKKGMTPEKKEKMLQYLDKREKNDVQDVRDLRDLLRGQFQERSANSNWSRVVFVTNMWNYLRSMGGVVISSLVDTGRHIMVHGFKDTIGVGIPALVTNLKGYKIATEEARMAGAVAESLLNTRIATLAEITDPYSAASPFERYIANLGSGFSRLNGMVYWNDFQKSFASVLTQNRLLRNVENWGAMSPKEKAYMHFLGIDEKMGQRILSEYKAAAQANPERAGLIKNIRVPGTESWADIEARSAFRAALNKDVDSIIVTRGYGDVPVFANTPTGKLVLQFRSFSLAAHQRVLMRGLQENHAGVYVGTMATILGGMMIYALKQIEQNKELSDNPGTWIAEGLDRSGLFTLFFEVNNAWEKLGAPGVYRSLAMTSPEASQKPPASRFATRTALSGFMGPTAGLLEEIAQVAAIPFKKETSEADINSAAKLTIGRTLPVFRSFLDYKVLPFIKDELGVKTK